MSTLVLKLEEQRVASYQQIASEMKLSPEELLGLLLDTFTRSRNAKIETTKKYVFKKSPKVAIAGSQMTKAERRAFLEKGTKIPDFEDFMREFEESRKDKPLYGRED